MIVESMLSYYAHSFILLCSFPLQYENTVSEVDNDNLVSRGAVTDMILVH